MTSLASMQRQALALQRGALMLAEQAAGLLEDLQAHAAGARKPTKKPPASDSFDDDETPASPETTSTGADDDEEA